VTARVAVVIPYWNAGGTIARALDSVGSQTSPPARVVIVDDGSDPANRVLLTNAADRLRGIAVEIVRLDRSAGPGAARNAGWTRVADDVSFVAFLDADDEWAPRKLEIQQRWMAENHSFAWSGHRCVHPATADAPVSRWSEVKPPVRYRRLRSLSLMMRNTVATPTVMVRADVPIRFRESWRQCEDLLLWLDLLDHGWPGAMLLVPLCRLGRVPGTPGGLTGDVDGMLRHEWRLAQTLHAEGRLSWPAAQAVQAVRWLAWRLRRRRALAC
jgi:glycosyltransferase involved in cell wall biosynthesis